MDDVQRDIMLAAFQQELLLQKTAAWPQTLARVGAQAGEVLMHPLRKIRTWAAPTVSREWYALSGSKKVREQLMQGGRMESQMLAEQLAAPKSTFSRIFSGGIAPDAAHAMREAETKGIDTWRGYLSRLVNPKTTWDTLKTGVKASWKSSPWWAKGMMAAQPAMNMLQTTDPVTGRERGVGERVGRTVGDLAMSMPGGGVIPGMLVGNLGSSVGGRIGRLADKGVAKVRPPTVQSPTREQEIGAPVPTAHAVERLYGPDMRGAQQ